MARPLRIEYAGAFYHVLNRGQRRYAPYLAQPAGDPFADVVGGAILSSPPFAEWVKNTFLSGRSAEPEIPALKVLPARPSVPRIVQAVAQYYEVTPEKILSPGGKRNHCRDVAICLAREFSGLPGRDLGGCFGGIGGPAVTMRCRAILQCAARDRRLARELHHPGE
jgi:hypothetical protein